MTKFNNILIAVAAVTEVAVSQNLLVNGSFEQPQVAPGTWDVFGQEQVPGWTALPPYQSFEIWNGLNGWPSADGAQHLESDFTKYNQVVSTSDDRLYRLSFFFSARPGVPSNHIQVFWNGTLVADLSRNGTGLGAPQWESWSSYVLGSDPTSILEVHSLGADPFVGMLVDDFRLMEADAPVAVYCAASASSAGCMASIGASSFAVGPTSGATDYLVTCANVHEWKPGLLIAGVSGPLSIPFGGGTLCVQPPVKRGPILNSGGSDVFGCNGSFSTVVNDGNLIPNGLDAGPGNSAWYQYWYRDPQNGAGNLGTALSNAIQLDFQ